MENQLRPAPRPQVTVRHAVAADVASIAPRMREDDVLECAAGSGSDPEEALLAGLDGICFTVEVNGRPEGMFGVLGRKNELGIVWMLGTDDLTANARVFLTDAPQWINELGRDHPVIGGFVWEPNTTHIGWLRRMGFQFFERRLINDQPFLEFAKCVTPLP